MINWGDYPNFTENEFRCKCGCGEADMQSGFMGSLQTIRTIAGFPFIVTSGYRCPAYNAEISSTGVTGPHTYGLAVDLSLYGSRARQVVGDAIALGFTGIGLDQKGQIKKRFIHLDSIQPGGVHPRPWVWTY